MGRMLDENENISWYYIYQHTQVQNLINYKKLDLRSLQNWNLKQLFFYIEAEWTNPENNIIQNDNQWEKNSQIDKLSRFEYPLRDVHNQLRGANIKFNVWVEKMPIIGIITREKLHVYEYQMPATYL
ncbi:hypothetical protein PPERSA_04747 [Pseudocohnilembus persalinus]|uniref:Signal peptidase complex subunit 3 n=1 Tax=Pseudocohnilembus persalinus TaxID=266149 RepID=A0A0V0QNZ1_PSEPJ|nr:hypothetical protein PPERSA_04747 [Pseudocohnilembus persalinus]|eukprot:KRX03869.1 hypothetical protein PPERSA_04747 [Pseudocohnilembus persalinus]